MAGRSADLIQNITGVLRRIAAKNSPLPVRLVAVSKLKPASDILALYEARETTGHAPHFGENYVQELIEKAEQLPKEVRWHFIGGLQSNKCKALAKIPNLWAVESVDTSKKADQLSKGRLEAGHPRLKVFIQVNTSGEESKSGCTPQEVEELARHIQEKCPGIELAGLMTIGAIARSKDAENPNEDFILLRKIRDELWEKLGYSKPEDLELSMGMSEDFEEAIRLGATNVRVGSTIFGERPKKSGAMPKQDVQTSTS